MTSLDKVDPDVAGIIRAENRRQHQKIRLIPSENYVSQAVLEATGSVLTNKYSEGYARERYYEGQQQIDRLEELCAQRVSDLFGAEHVNVQPYSGSPANQAVYLAPISTVYRLHDGTRLHHKHAYIESIAGTDLADGTGYHVLHT